MNRRDFSLMTLPGFFALLDAQRTSMAQTVMKSDAHAALRRIIFRSQTGKLGIMNLDGSDQGVDHPRFLVAFKY